MNRLVVLHKEHQKNSGAESFELDPAFRGFFYWRTCVRSLWIGFVNDHELPQVSELANPFDCLIGESAYGFLLEVICGLRSPLIGETEVAGQFRNFYASQDLAQSYFSLEWKKLFSSLMSDLKWIRSTHLIGLGSQSYGSLARRLLRDHSGITMIGGGHLAQEILPWLSKDHTENADSSLSCVVRRKDARDTLSVQFPRVSFCSFESLFPLSNQALIVAAPLAAAEFNKWLAKHDVSLKTIIDLREDSQTDVIHGSKKVTVLTLNDFFQMIQQNKSQLEEKVQQARHAILGRTQERFQEQSIRPFGWDDVCA
ncbi:MAG: hypothetical protein AB7O96_16645 [Pseudobdellovibrionaceae bacterium]